MKYMLLACGGDTAGASGMAPVEPWVQELGECRVRLHGLRLGLPAKATPVRDGEVLRIDGPFAETKEHVAGFDVLECDSLGKVVEAAAKHPVAGIGSWSCGPSDRCGSGRTPKKAIWALDAEGRRRARLGARPGLLRLRRRDRPPWPARP
ncbi:YciI family protein [Streptomyces sp. NRRL B-24085]|uniref:YciI family protein n=1 Tax=Streptomyces sp. NRRL B-24085 TaxID=1709476 RepID=UPI000AAF61EB|nr:YciI family protein [Streptomyces sp. NRRL B-24085]